MNFADFKQWGKDVLGAGFRAICFWVAVAINILAVVIQSLLPETHKLPSYVAWCLKYVTPPAIFIGFVLSNVYAYSIAMRERRRLAEELDGITVDLEKAEAGEFLAPTDTQMAGPAHHHVKVFFKLVARNRNAEWAGTLELITCDANLRRGGPDCLFFETDQIGNYIDQQGKRRRIENGDVRELRVVAIYRFPISEGYISATTVEGHLQFRDHRKTSIAPVRFSTGIFKNDIPAECFRVAPRDSALSCVNGRSGDSEDR